MLWEHEQCCGNTSRRNTENMFPITFIKQRDEKKENHLLTLNIKMQILYASAIITSTAHASSEL